MAATRSNPREQRKGAVTALGLFFVLACATPAIASQTTPSDCAELEGAGLQVPSIKFAAATVGKAEAAGPDSAALGTQPKSTATPAPLIEAPADDVSMHELYGVRAPLAETAPADDAENTVPHEQELADRVPEMQTRFPGVSSVELKRFKRQMYRRDI